MAFEHWYCEQCWNENTVQHKKNAGVMQVRNMIAYQHQRKAPRCASFYDLTYVRVGFPPDRNAEGKEPAK